MRSLPLLVGLGCVCAGPTELFAQHAIEGTVRDSATGAPLDEVVITVQGQTGSARTTPGGRFRIINLPPGPVDLHVRRIGYQPREITGVRVPRRAPLDVTLAPPAVVPLEDLLARGERRGDVTAPLDHVITRDEVTARPYLGEDAYRTLTRTPGVTADEMSARFRMRGAEQEEVLVRLDGMTLVDPFHLNDLSGTFSVVDGHWIERATVGAAGFGAQYGDRTAGVVEFATPEPSPARNQVFLSASPTHVRAATEGAWGRGRGGWIVSARRGVPDLVLAALGRASAYSPGYLDGMAKVTFMPNADHALSAHLLVGVDRLDVRMDQGQMLSQSRSRRAYGWVRWRAGWSGTLRTETVMSLTGIVPVRDVDFIPRYPNGVSDRRELMQLGVRHDVDWILGGTVGVRAGAEVQRGRARYDYAFHVPITIRSSGEAEAAATHADTGTARIAQDGLAVAAYLAPRVRLWERLEVEAGLRYDHASHAGRPRVGPRVRSRLDVTDGLALVGSWGRYSQAKGLHELNVVGGERTWAVQQATQTTAGVEWQPAGDTRVRVEGYRRLVTQPWARQLNIELGFEVVPEVDEDNLFVAPVRGRADGIDVDVEGRLGASLHWRAGYTLSRVEDLVQRAWVPRTYDQRHAVTADVAWRPSRRWSLAAAWQSHSGWPITEPDFARYTLQGSRVIPSYDYTRLGESRLPAYSRLDLRVRHDMHMAGGTLGLSLDLVNVLNRRNVRGISYDGALNPDGSVAVQRNPLTMAPLAPIIGVSWAH